MKSKILFVLCLLAGLMFINAGLDKLFHYMPVPKDMPEKMLNSMKAFTEIGWIMPLVGLVEVVGGALFIFRKTRALGAIVLLPVLVGILLTNIYVAPSGLPISGVLLAIVIWAMIDNKEKYTPMISDQRSVR